LKHIDLEGVNKEYEDELRAYEAEVEKSRRLKVVELFLNEKEKRLSTIKEEIGWLSQTGTQSLSRSLSFSADVFSDVERNSLSTKSANLSTLLDTLAKSLETLLKTPSPSTSHRPERKGEEGRESLGVWNDSRSSFINWVAGKQASTAGVGAVRGGRSGRDVRESSGEGEAVGTKGDAKVCFDFFFGRTHRSSRQF